MTCGDREESELFIVGFVSQGMKGGAIFRLFCVALTFILGSLRKNKRLQKISFVVEKSLTRKEQLVLSNYYGRRREQGIIMNSLRRF